MHLEELLALSLCLEVLEVQEQVELVQVVLAVQEQELALNNSQTHSQALEAWAVWAA